MQTIGQLAWAGLLPKLEFNELGQRQQVASTSVLIATSKGVRGFGLNAPAS